MLERLALSRRVASATDWPIASRVAFRCVFAYVLVLLASYAWAFAPLALPAMAVSGVVWEAIVTWVASHILLVPPPPVFSDADGLGKWIQLGCCVVFAMVATLIWSVADRRRKSYAKLHDWLRVIVRYARLRMPN